MKNNRLIIIGMFLLMVSVVAGCVHFNTREDVAEGQLKVTYGEDEKTLNLDQLEYEELSGIRMNGKGEEIPMEGDGIQMKNLLSLLEVEQYEKIEILAEDSYTAEITAEEVTEDNNVCLFLQEEGGMRLVVFQDKNSKRCVANVVLIRIQ